MKNWFLFGSGLFLGIFLGAYLVFFLFYDDLSHGQGGGSHAAATTRADPLKSSRSPSNLQAKTSSASLPHGMFPSASLSENPPPALPAQAVDPDSVDSTQPSAVMSSARNSSPSVDSAAQ